MFLNLIWSFQYSIFSFLKASLSKCCNFAKKDWFYLDYQIPFHICCSSSIPYSSLTWLSKQENCCIWEILFVLKQFTFIKFFCYFIVLSSWYFFLSNTQECKHMIPVASSLDRSVPSLSQDNEIKHHQMWLFLGWVTREGSLPYMQLAHLSGHWW